MKLVLVFYHICFLSFPLPMSISMFHWVSSFPLACRTRGWEKSGQFEDMISPSHSLILSLALSALQSPLSTLITYINLSNKKTALDFPVSALYGVKEWPGLCTCVHVCSAQTPVNSQSGDCWVVVYHPIVSLCNKSERNKYVLSAYCEWWHCHEKRRRRQAKKCMLLYVCSRISDQEEELIEKLDMDGWMEQIELRPVCTCFLLSRFQTVDGKPTNVVNYLAHIVAYVPQWE